MNSVAPIGQISSKFDTGEFYENLFRTSNLVDIGLKYRTHCKKTSVRFIVASGIK